MPTLETAITAVAILTGVAVAMLFGDFLGNRVGRARLAIALGVFVLIAVVVFTIYAGVVLLGQKS